MIINITELFTVKRKSIDPILHWLDQHVGAYIGPGTGFSNNLYIDGQKLCMHIGNGWQINVVDFVDSYGHTMIYELDITDDRLATFFILKFL